MKGKRQTKASSTSSCFYSSSCSFFLRRINVPGMADLSNSGKKHALKNGTFASAVRLGNPVRCWGSDARPWKSCPFRKRKTRLRKGGVATDYISKDYVTIFNFNFHFFLFSFLSFFFFFFPLLLQEKYPTFSKLHPGNGRHTLLPSACVTQQRRSRTI